jgi:hypothetical protein
MGAAIMAERDASITLLMTHLDQALEDKKPATIA